MTTASTMKKLSMYDLLNDIKRLTDEKYDVDIKRLTIEIYFLHNFNKATLTSLKSDYFHKTFWITIFREKPILKVTNNCVN